MTALFATTGASGAAVGTATITADTFTITAHGLVNGQVVVTSAPTGAAVGVLVPGAPYYVASATANTFQLRPAPGAAAMSIASGGAVVDAADAVYDPQGMRRALGGLLAKNRQSIPSFGRFDARPGVLPNHSAVEVSVAGMLVTVTDLNCVIVGPTSSGRGPYLCAIPTSQITLTAADPSNPRIDLLIAEVLDDAADSSGDLVPGRTRVITGTPAAVPTVPATPSGALALAQFAVPAGGASATLTYTADYTTAAGGIIPVRDTAGLPTVWNREGMYADQADTDTLMRWNGSTWVPVASAASYASVRRIATTIRTTNTSTFTAETLINSVTAALESGKTYRVRWVANVASSVLGDLTRTRIREDNLAGTQLQLRNVGVPNGGTDFPVALEVEYTAGSTGNKTFAATCQRVSGTGNIACNANASQPIYFYVDYIRG